MEVRCEPATRPCRPSRCVSQASVSIWRDSGSSVSSQCMSTSRPRSAAISHSAATLSAAPSSIVRSKCGMPPTTSTPRSSARFRFSARARRAVVAVLREGDELQVEIGRDLRLHLEQRLDGEQPVVADVDMAADREQALRYRQVAVAQRPLDHRLVREERLQLAPERDAFEQRAGLVEARQAERQRRVHVEVAVDEGRRDEVAAGVDGVAGLRRRSAARRRRSGRPRTAMSRPARPSGRVALRTIRSKLMGGSRLSLALEIRDHQRLRVVGAARDRRPRRRWRGDRAASGKPGRARRRRGGAGAGAGRRRRRRRGARRGAPCRGAMRRRR